MELERGTLFAGYVVERLVSDGGMGSVYLARHPHLPRLEALKLLRPELCGDPVFAARFHREAETVAQLSHPHILPVHDRGSEDGQLWISMPYVDGRDAAAAVSACPGGLTPEFAVHVLGQIGSALDYAHRQKLLHRDVKPANILLTAAPEADEPEWAFLTDFGIAKSADDAGRLTRAGDVIATFQYASPEQIEGSDLDHRSDIYSLGCVLYELLTGRLPYPGPSVAAAIHAHVNLPPPRPTEATDGLPCGFDEVVTTAMAKNPEDRFQSCRALTMAAHRALTSTPAVRTRPVPPPPATTFDTSAGETSPDHRTPTPPAPDAPPDPAMGTGESDRVATAPPPFAPLPARRRRSRRWPAVLTVGLLVATIGGAAAVVLRPTAQPVPVIATGTVRTWGTGAEGQLGNGSQDDGSPLPVVVSGLTGAVAIAGGYSNGYALMSDGTVQGWGLGDEHQLGDIGAPLIRNEPIPVAGLAHVTAVSGGSGTGYALIDDGTVMTWGRGDQGQLGTGSIPSGGAAPAPVSGLTGVTAISGGYTNGYARRTDGTVMAWGQGDKGQLGNGGSTNSPTPVPVTGLTDVAAISGGSGNGYALLADGTVMAWGQGDKGLLGNGGTTGSAVPVPVTGLIGVTEISCRSENCYALLADRTVMAWGQGGNGQLGNGSTSDSAIPVAVDDLEGIGAIAGGSGTGFALH